MMYTMFSTGCWLLYFSYDISTRFDLFVDNKTGKISVDKDNNPFNYEVSNETSVNVYIYFLKLQHWI